MNCPRCSSTDLRYFRSRRMMRCRRCGREWAVQPSSCFVCFNHQSKANAYVTALEQRGYVLTSHERDAGFALTDADIGGRRSQLDRLFEHSHARVFLYPHQARPNIWHVFFEEWPHITAQFVTAPGHVDVVRRIGFSKPVHAVGWSLCEMRPFQPRSSYRRVLFAPIHPNANGFLSKLHKDINRAVFARLIDLVECGEIDLTIRYIHPLPLNGLEEHPAVTYIEGQPDQSHAQIDEADVVIGHQTFAYIAVARGVPTVMMAEWEAPMYGNSPEKLIQAERWEEYRDLMMYPLDILAEDDTPALFARAIQSDAEIVDWRARMIGQPFDGGCFVDILEKYL